jgi:membrane protein
MTGDLRALGRTAARAGRGFLQDDCPRLSAALSYYTVFSIPPVLALLTLLAGRIWPPERIRELLSTEAGRLIGPGGAVQIISLVEGAAAPESTGLSAALGILALLFSGSGAFLELQNALNTAWSVAPDPRRSKIRGFLLKRVTSLAMLAGTGFLMLVSLVVSAILAGFADVIRGVSPSWMSPSVLTVFDFTASLVVISLLFAVIFQFVPDARVRWRHALVGGVFTGILFSGGKMAIGYYLGRSDPGSVYGAAGSLVVALLWIYYSTMILLLGAEFTESWAEDHGTPTMPRPGAVRIRSTVVESTA